MCINSIGQRSIGRHSITADRGADNVRDTVDRGTDHAGEAPEEGEEAEGRGEVVQAHQLHEHDGGERDVGGWGGANGGGGRGRGWR